MRFGGMLVEIKLHNIWRNGAMVVMKPGIIYDRDRPCLFYYYYYDVNGANYLEWDIMEYRYRKLFMVIDHFGKLVARHPPGHRVYEMPEGSAEILQDIIYLDGRRPERIDAIIDAIDLTSRWEDIASAIEHEALTARGAEARRNLGACWWR